jgi:FtsZ-interacting cell division protein ZipA
MEPFSAELLTILVLICIIWAGITLIAVLIIIIIFLCKLCSKHRGSKFIRPIRTPSTVSIENHSRVITPVPIKTIDQDKKSTPRYDTHNNLDEHAYSNHKNKYQQQEYMRDENDDTTTINDARMYVQRQQKRSYQPIKPLSTDIRVSDRHTPYPADVIARDRLMNCTRFSTEKKY